MRIFFLIAFLTVTISPAISQENYEIQVYGSETMAKNTTIFELHSNYTGRGTRTIENGVFPTNHSIHETIEITHGFTENFELGFYLFNAIGSQNRTGFVGTHIRPRIRVPEKWNWPVGISLSTELGYQNLAYSEDDWSLEIRPIIDKRFDKFYISFNPVFDKSLHGLNKNEKPGFSPNIKTSYDFSSKVAAGFEYYGSLGTIGHFLPFSAQDHCLFIATDLDLDPRWEFNFGYGIGLNSKTDAGIFKMILGYRLKR
jgi:hypothetical protein